jgi:CBS domain-containing membrane protein
MSLAKIAVMKSVPTLVRDVMSVEVVMLGRNDKLVAAEDLMRLGRIRHLPVVDEDGGLAGIVSQRDLFHSGLIRALGYGAHAQQHALASVTVKEAMTTEVVTTTPNTPLREAARTMLELKIGCLVVVEAGRVAGLVAESDFVKLATREP